MLGGFFCNTAEQMGNRQETMGRGGEVNFEFRISIQQKLQRRPLRFPRVFSRPSVEIDWVFDPGVRGNIVNHDDEIGSDWIGLRG